MALFPFLTLACTAPVTWHTDCSGVGIARLSLSVENTYRGIQFEILTLGNGQQRFYFNVFSIPFDSCKCSEIPAILTWADRQIETSLPVLAGGQKFLIPACVANEIVEALLDGNPVDVQIGRYSSTLCPKGFAAAYKKFSQV